MKLVKRKEQPCELTICKAFSFTAVTDQTVLGPNNLILKSIMDEGFNITKYRD